MLKDFYNLALQLDLIGYEIIINDINRIKINNVMVCDISYSDHNGLEVVLTGDISPDENGNIKCRKLFLKGFNDIYFSCDYDKIFSVKIENEDITIRKSNIEIYNRYLQ